jgi:hypothetical protein
MPTPSKGAVTLNRIAPQAQPPVRSIMISSDWPTITHYFNNLLLTALCQQSGSSKLGHATH